MNLIFDSHLDLAWNAMSWNRDLTLPVSEIRAAEAGMTDDDARGRGTVSLPEMRRGGIAFCCATLLARAKPAVKPTRKIDLDARTQQIACATARGQLAYYQLLAERGEVAFIRTAHDLAEHHQLWLNGADSLSLPIGIILAMEGADPITHPEQAEQWWNLGLRCVGLAHYGKSRYAVGTGEAGPLTHAGVALRKEFERLGMILDLTHCSDPSFYQAIELFSGNVMASHNNCRALVPGDRQFSDEQIRMLIARGGVIGVALDAWMLKPGFEIGKTPGSEVDLSAAADHIDHICQLAGNVNHVAVGSDLDGGFGTEQSPHGIETITDLQALKGMLSYRSYAASDVEKILIGNWLRFFTHALPNMPRALGP
jgi:membrane dipeptidase